MKNVLQKLLLFRKQRDWKKFHTPQNIAKSIVLEASEILEIFQWKTNSELSIEEKVKLSHEMADVYNWLILLSFDLGIDLEKAALEKIKLNAKKYPVQKVKGEAKKYTAL